MMHPVTSVVSLPAADLNRSLRFYRDGFGLEGLTIDEDVLAIELPNLSLFLIESGEFQGYLERAGIAARSAIDPAPCILSVALGTRGEVEDLVLRAAGAGGLVQAPIEMDGTSTAYVRDPDGHVWELVHNDRTARQAQEQGGPR